MSRLDRLSGLWGAQTPLGLWLQENEITILFFGGVNADQCVVSLIPSLKSFRMFADTSSGVHFLTLITRYDVFEIA